MLILSRLLSRAALAAAVLALPAASSLLAQTASVPPAAPPAASAMEFDVVSVKPNTSESGMMRIGNRPGVFSASGVTLKTIMSQAYNIREDLISGGPGWVGASAWDLEGKIAPADADALKAMTNDQRAAAQRQMVQHALEDRFKLKTHIETKTLPVYELVLAKGGSKLKEADPNAPLPDGVPAPPAGAPRGGMMRFQQGKLEGLGIAVSGMTGFLARTVERTVIDKTGLTGKYDFTLTWTPDTGPAGQATGASSDSNAPDLFTAIQEQLGLKLVASRGPVDTLVIDSVEKPTEN